MKTPSRNPDNLLLLLLPVLLALTLAGCQGEGQTGGEASAQMTGDGISIENSWARPAGMGRMSAGYLRITNAGEAPDTLIGLSSGVARLTELHESYEQEEGMAGMREVGELLIPAGSTVELEPGGLHIMFIQLTEDLDEGDEIDVILEFANRGEVTVPLSVRPQ